MLNWSGQCFIIQEQRLAFSSFLRRKRLLLLCTVFISSLLKRQKTSLKQLFPHFLDSLEAAAWSIKAKGWAIMVIGYQCSPFPRSSLFNTWCIYCSLICRQFCNHNKLGNDPLGHLRTAALKYWCGSPLKSRQPQTFILLGTVIVELVHLDSLLVHPSNWSHILDSSYNHMVEQFIWQLNLNLVLSKHSNPCSGQGCCKHAEKHICGS